MQVLSFSDPMKPPALLSADHVFSSETELPLVRNLRDYELITSPSKDKRWAIRESSAKVSRFYLLSPVREVNDEQWGPDWNELLTLEPAPVVVMDSDAVDPAQQ